LTSVFAKKIFQLHSEKETAKCKTVNRKTSGGALDESAGMNLDRFLVAQREKKRISIAPFVIAGLTFYFFMISFNRRRYYLQLTLTLNA
jgi:hypothetical protein